MVEQRANIKFCFKTGKSASETLEIMQQVYKGNCLSRAQIYRWYARFKDGREDLEDNERSGRPVICRNDDFIEKIRKQIKINRCSSLRMMAVDFGIDKESVRKTICEDLCLKKVSERFVPLAQSEDQLYDRIKYAKDIIKTSLKNPKFLDSIVTGDEIWCFHYEPRRKDNNKNIDPSKPKKSRFYIDFTSRLKTLLIIFYDSKGVIHHEFVPENVPFTGTFYLSVLGRLLKRIIRTRPEYYAPGSWYLLHGNTPIHKNIAVLNFLAQKQVCVLANPMYSPDLTPCDYFLFPKLKSVMKTEHHEDIKDLENSVRLCIETIPKMQLRQSFLDLIERATHCIEAGGAYVEETK